MEHSRGRAPAAGAGGDDGDELSESPLTCRIALGLTLHFAGAVAIGFGGERNADGIADALLATKCPWLTDEATMPLEPMPASVRPKCRAWLERCASLCIDGDTRSCTALDFCGQDDVVAGSGLFPRRARRKSMPDCTMASCITSRAVSGAPLASAAFSSMRRVSKS